MEYKIEEKKSLLTRLRERNDHDKKVFAIIISSIVTFIILSIWLVTFINSLPNTDGEIEEKKQQGPFSVFVEYVRSAF